MMLVGTAGLGVAAAQPQGELTYAMHVTIAPAWFDPADNTGIATPFMVQEALHDALVKPMPHNPMAPGLAESWTESADGLRARFRSMERVAYLTAWKDKKLKNLLFCGAGGYGNAATRVENYFVTGGAYSLGGQPDLDDLFQQQARELDRKKREALLHRIQRLASERVLFIPIYALYFNNGVGPRVQESSLNRIPLHYYTAPFEDVRLKGH